MPSQTSQQLMQELRIGNLLTEFCWLIDRERFEEAAHLYTEDAVIETPMFKVCGKKEIVEGLLAQRKNGDLVTRHSWENLRIEHLSEDKVRAYSNATTYSGQGEVPLKKTDIMVGAAEDLLVLVEGEWRFSHRKLNVLCRGQAVSNVE
ncbi:MAG: nuclear transport factor 2 family protein [Emcibacter sp.]|nr:nuclear transport factor 2 family protein [Emcibacter sp.]